jgi:hypothetical protein
VQLFRFGGHSSSFVTDAPRAFPPRAAWG